MVGQVCRQNKAIDQETQSTRGALTACLAAFVTRMDRRCFGLGSTWGYVFANWRGSSQTWVLVFGMDEGTSETDTGLVCTFCFPAASIPRETLMHFTARLGLSRLASFLLQQPGGQEALGIPNLDGATPINLAAQRGFRGLEQLFAQ